MTKCDGTHKDIPCPNSLEAEWKCEGFYQTTYHCSECMLKISKTYPIHPIFESLKKEGMFFDIWKQKKRYVIYTNYERKKPSEWAKTQSF